jgi:hypothetical protein
LALPAAPQLPAGAVERLPRSELGIADLDADPFWRLVAAFLVECRREQTRRAYFNDLRAWYAWASLAYAPTPSRRSRRARAASLCTVSTSSRATAPVSRSSPPHSGHSPPGSSTVDSRAPRSHRLAQVSHASIAATVAAPHPVRDRTGAHGDFVEDVAIADFAGSLLRSESLGRR